MSNLKYVALSSISSYFGQISFLRQYILILLIVLLVVDGGTDAITDKPYILQKNLISMNLLQMSCVITWAWAFLTSEVVEAVRGQKHHNSAHTFGSSISASSAY